MGRDTETTMIKEYRTTSYMKKSNTPRTDAAADHTAPEKMHQLCRQLERKCAAQAKAIRGVLRVFPDLETWERGDGSSLRPLTERLKQLSSTQHIVRPHRK